MGVCEKLAVVDVTVMGGLIVLTDRVGRLVVSGRLVDVAVVGALVVLTDRVRVVTGRLVDGVVAGEEAVVEVMLLPLLLLTLETLTIININDCETRFCEQLQKLLKLTVLTLVCKQ